MSAYELCHSKMQVGKKTPNSAWHNSKFQSVFDSSCEEAAGGQADLVSSPVTLSGRCRKSWVQNLRDGLLTSWRRWSCKEKRGSFYKEPLTWTGPFAGALSKDTLFSLWLNLCLSHSSSSPFSSTSPPPPRAALWLVALEVEQVEEQVTWPRNNRHSSTEASESLWLPKHVLMGKMFSKRKQEDLQRSHVSETIASYKSIIATHLTSEVKSLLRRSPWWFGDNTTSGIISFKMFVPPPSCLISSNLKL